jgi:hypothetical protein
MFSAQEVALNITTASVQLRVLHNSVYLSARLQGTNYWEWNKIHNMNFVVHLFLMILLSENVNQEGNNGSDM